MGSKSKNGDDTVKIARKAAERRRKRTLKKFESESKKGRKEEAARERSQQVSRISNYDYTLFFYLGAESRENIFQETWLELCRGKIASDYIKNIIGDMEDNTMDVMGFREKKSNKIIAILFFQKPTKFRNYYNIELLCANRRYLAAGKQLMEAFENRSDVLNPYITDEIRLKPANKQLYKYYESIGYSPLKAGSDFMSKTIIKDTPTRN